MSASSKGESGRKHKFSSRTKVWVADTGASYHLIGEQDLTATERKRMRRLRKPFPVSTANGIVQIESSVPIRIPELGIRVECSVLPNSPSLL